LKTPIFRTILYENQHVSLVRPQAQAHDKRLLADGYAKRWRVA